MIEDKDWHQAIGRRYQKIPIFGLYTIFLFFFSIIKSLEHNRLVD